MQRTITNKQPSCIITGDWHLREDIPICRTDNFWESQWRKVTFISELQKKYDCEIVHAGDLFHHWKPSPFLLSTTIKHLPNKFSTIYGNHDLPQHNLELSDKCGINVLKEAGKLTVLEECHWGQEPNKGSLFFPEIDKSILVWHIMNYQGKLPWPGCTSPMAITLLKKHYSFPLIITSDNHKPFVEEYEGRLLVNPGSLMRQAADQVDHKPRVYLWHAETNMVTPVYIPIEEGIISREHIDVKERRDSRIEAFVEQLNGDWDVKLSFEDNLEAFIGINNIDKEVENIIFKAIE